MNPEWKGGQPKIRMEKQWNEDDGTKRISGDVNKKGREGEKI